MMLLKKLYNLVVTKVNAIGTKVPSTSGLVLKPQYSSDNQNLEKKIEDADKKIRNTSRLVEKTY